MTARRKRKLKVANKAHSSLGASNASRWMNCAGSVHLAKDMPDEQTEAGWRGSVIHTAVETALEEDIAIDELVGVAVAPEDAPNRDETVFTDDMADLVRSWVNQCRQRMRDADGYALEKIVGLRKLDSRLHGIWGSPDMVLWKGDTMTVSDLKTGYFRVGLTDNPQLQIYGLGALAEFGQPGMTLFLEVVQPRVWGQPLGMVFAEDSQRTFRGDLLSSVARVEAARDHPEQHVRKGKWCRWCRAKPVCPLWQRKRRR